MPCQSESQSFDLRWNVLAGGRSTASRLTCLAKPGYFSLSQLPSQSKSCSGGPGGPLPVEWEAGLTPLPARTFHLKSNELDSD